MSVATLTQTQPQPAAADRSPRWIGLDVARLAAALAIVWIHVPRSPELFAANILARFAVPFFTCMAVYFVFQKVGSGGAGNWRAYVGSRCQRIYGPFLVWSGVYLAFKHLKSLVAPEQANQFGGWEMLYTGSFCHLWFLPFILVVSLAAYPLARFAASGAGRRHAVAVVCGLLGAVVALAPVRMTDESLQFMWFALPAALWGATLATTVRLTGREARGSRAIGLAMWLAASATLLAVGRLSWLENLAGVGYALLACSWSPAGALARLRGLGQVSFGIYCCHLLWVKSIESLCTKAGFTATAALDLFVFAASIVLSVALAWVLSLHRWTRPLVV